jgi:hypothetical protein
MEQLVQIKCGLLPNKNDQTVYIHEHPKNGLPFWCNSPQYMKMFRTQKNIIRIMLGCRRRDSCRNIFRNLEILALASQDILSLMLFVTKSRNKFTANSEIYRMNTRQQNNLHQPSVNLKKY